MRGAANFPVLGLEDHGRSLASAAQSGMVTGMATKKVTVTLDENQLVNIQALVARGKAESVSGFVQHAVTVSLADIAGWGAMLGLALSETGGPLTPKERAWADSILRKARSRRLPTRKGRAA